MTGPASYGNPLAVVEAGGDEAYFRAIQGTDPASGSVIVAGVIPVGAVVQLTTADTDDILGGTRAALERATDAFPAGARARGGARSSRAPCGGSCSARGRGSRRRWRGRSSGPTLPIAGIYCFGEIGPVRGVDDQPLLQRDVRDAAARHVSDDPRPHRNRRRPSAREGDRPAEAAGRSARGPARAGRGRSATRTPRPSNASAASWRPRRRGRMRSCSTSCPSRSSNGSTRASS